MYILPWRNYHIMTSTNFLLNMLSYFRPPSFKQVTPTCRTNVRQLLHREQMLQQEQRNQSSCSTTASQEGISGKKRQNREFSSNIIYPDTQSTYKVIHFLINPIISLAIYNVCVT